PGSATTLTKGQMNIILNPPSPANGISGSADLAVNLGLTGTATDNSCLTIHPATTAANEAYLRGGNGNCAAATTNPPSADPSATATFGIYTPENQRTVHVREIY
ncbi:MAG TPA: hypothetical protein VNW52_04940, partial [Burkholderiaceae bacterium]|nr:hypothetical protein [Burkholderiaceae bacterium]